MYGGWKKKNKGNLMSAESHYCTQDTREEGRKSIESH